MTVECRNRLVVDKEQLRSEFHRLQRALGEYRTFLAAVDSGEGGSETWPSEAVAVLRSQQLALLRARVSLGSGELALALLQQVLERVAVSALRFRPRRDVATGNGHVHSEAVAAATHPAPPELGELLAVLHAAAETAPLELQDKLRRALAGVQDFFAALADQQAEQLDAAISRINLATANVETRNLLREIAIVTRDVYRTLQSVSEELPLDALSQSSGGITEAVRRLNSVVVRLDDAATQNLDHLEALGRITTAETAAMGEATQSLRAAQKRLMELKARHPDLEERLTAIQQRLADEVGGPVMTLRHQLGLGAEHHMELISNQGFQELTGRTLKKIIEFVESLEGELYDLLKQYRPAGESAAPPADVPAQTDVGAPAPAAGTQTQDDVDKLLGELGF
ncbi:MAG TPA: protein phosphatase CheZ [bacterium]|nr:protein phosphatase CheZ [bacterium]